MQGGERVGHTRSHYDLVWRRLNMEALLVWLGSSCIAGGGGEMSISLAEALPIEQARVREIIVQYRSVGPGGIPAAILMEADLRSADTAAASGDVVAMMQAYEELKGWQS
jgi:hypothetical protein